jgi:hypothetical protein
MVRTAEDPGNIHLVRIGRFQWLLEVVGSLLWLLRSWRSAVVFAAGGATSMAFWYLHRWIVARMLTPSIRMRWVYGFLAVVKLALLALFLRAIMDLFPLEVIPVATGIPLFSAAILLEAFFLIFRPEED